MQENEMLQCWKTLNLQLEKSLVLNRQNTIDITAIKVAGQLGSMKPIKIFTLLTGLELHTRLYLLTAETILWHFVDQAGVQFAIPF